MSASISCKDCGCILSEAGTNKPCPDCRSLDRNILASDSGTLVESQTRVRGRQDGVPGYAYEHTYREELSEHAVLSRVTTIIDRRQPHKTRTEHQVEHESESGEWEVVHYHLDEWPAKHRRLASGQA